MFRLISVVIVIIGLLLGGFLWHAGFFTKVVISETQAGPYILVYQSQQGDYAYSSKIMDTIFNWLKARNIHTTRGFGIYFDDPMLAEKETLRSVVGNILEPKDRDKLPMIKEKYQVNDFPRQDCLKVVFPYRSSLSVVAGIMKVYPAVEAYMKENKMQSTAAVEIYDLSHKELTYLFPFLPKEELAEKYFVTPE